jgi:peroxisome-assembly ATPase
VAEQMMDQAWLLCFDEFQVTEVGDALILRRLFGELFRLGAVVVATSNRPPTDLYEGGLNRELFLPFIQLLQERCEVWPIGSSQDYRLRHRVLNSLYQLGPRSPSGSLLLGQQSPHYPLARETFEACCRQQAALGPNAPLAVVPRTVQVQQQRQLALSETFGSVCLLHWSELCQRPLGAADYLALAEHFRTVVLYGVPRMDRSWLNEARRFITLIDVLYESRVRLAIVADCPLVSLLELDADPEPAPHSHPSVPFTHANANQQSSTSGGAARETSFAFNRTLSRLMEMQSESYWTASDPTSK